MAAHPITIPPSSPLKVKILIDGGSFIYYRTCATLSWYKRKKDVDPPSLDNPIFLESLRSQYHSSLAKMVKQITNHYYPLLRRKKQSDSSSPSPPLTLKDDCLFIKDCRREHIWRQDLYPDYKGHRSHLPIVSECIQYLFDQFINHHSNNKDATREASDDITSPPCCCLFERVIKVDRMEADDIIAVLAKSLVAQNENQRVVIVSLDSDFQQLLSCPNIALYNPKNGLITTSVSPEKILQSLEEKILKGDVSDNIKKATNPVEIERNRHLIDFNYIPSPLQTLILNTYYGNTPSSQ